MNNVDTDYYQSVIKNISKTRKNRVICSFKTKSIGDDNRVKKISLHSGEIVFRKSTRISFSELQSIHNHGNKFELKYAQNSVVFEILEQAKNIFGVPNRDLFLIVLLELLTCPEDSEIIGLINTDKKTRATWFGHIMGITTGSIIFCFSVSYCSFKVGDKYFGWGSLIWGLMFLSFLWIPIGIRNKYLNQVKFLKKYKILPLRTFILHYKNSKLMDKTMKEYVYSRILDYLETIKKEMGESEDYFQLAQEVNSLKK